MSLSDTAPDFTLPNPFWKNVLLAEALKEGFVIIKFYRVQWCPICNLDLREIQKNLPEIQALGATLFAISPQSPDGALTAAQKNELGYEVLSDAHQEVIKAYNLQFDPGEDYHQRRDLTKENGDGSKTLPVPATFIIGKNGKVVAGHVEADYTQRMSALEVALKAL